MATSTITVLLLIIGCCGHILAAPPPSNGEAVVGENGAGSSNGEAVVGENGAGSSNGEAVVGENDAGSSNGEAMVGENGAGIHQEGGSSIGACVQKCEEGCKKVHLDCQFLDENIPVLCDRGRVACKGKCHRRCICLGQCDCKNVEGCDDSCSSKCFDKMEEVVEKIDEELEETTEQANPDKLPVKYIATKEDEEPVTKQ